MKNRSFFYGATREIKIVFLGFIVAGIGVILGFIGYAVEIKILSILGFGVCIIGIMVGVYGVLHGWIQNLKKILKVIKRKTRNSN